MWCGSHELELRQSKKPSSAVAIVGKLCMEASKIFIVHYLNSLGNSHCAMSFIRAWANESTRMNHKLLGSAFIAKQSVLWPLRTAEELKVA